MPWLESIGRNSMFPIALNLTTVPVLLYGYGDLTLKRLAYLDEAKAAHVKVFCDEPSEALRKAAGERLVVNENPAQTYIVRTAWLYSKYKSNFVKTMLKLAQEEYKSVKVVNDQFGQPTLASDLAVRIHQMIDQQLSPGIYHGTNSGEVSWYDFAREIFILNGADPSRILPVDSQYYSRPAKRPTNSVLGHKNWLEEGVDPMRNWKGALKSAFPAILAQVELER
jgi:dTDP-4-dehydrorhamnose reductase